MSKAVFNSKIPLRMEDFPYQWDVIENVWIPMADGCKCSARIWRPRTDVPLPTVFETQPYRKRDGMRGRDEPMYGYFAGHVIMSFVLICEERENPISAFMMSI